MYFVLLIFLIEGFHIYVQLLQGLFKTLHAQMNMSTLPLKESTARNTVKINSFSSQYVEFFCNLRTITLSKFKSGAIKS